MISLYQINQNYRPCCYGNHDWKQVTPPRHTTIDKERVLVINYVCQDCLAICQTKEGVR